MAHRRGEVDKRRMPVGAPRKSWVVSDLWDVHKEITRRIVLGQKNKVIAEALNCTVAMVSLVRNSPAIKEQTELMQGAADAHCVDVAQRIVEMAPKALDVLEGILEGDEPASTALRLKTAESILDRAGNSKITKNHSITTHLSAEQLEAIKQRGLEKAREAGIIVEAVAL